MFPFVFAPFSITTAVTGAASKETGDAVEAIGSRGLMFPFVFAPFSITAAVTDAALRATAYWLDASCGRLTSVGPARPDLSDMSTSDLRALIGRLESELSRRGHSDS